MACGDRRKFFNEISSVVLCRGHGPVVFERKNIFRERIQMIDVTLEQSSGNRGIGGNSVGSADFKLRSVRISAVLAGLMLRFQPNRSMGGALCPELRIF